MDIEEPELHFFQKIRSFNMHKYIFTYLNMSDIGSLFNVSKRFRNMLKRNNNEIHVQIANQVYGTNLGEDFNKSPHSSISTRKVQTNITPIEILIFIESLDKIITSGGPYESGPVLKVWKYSSHLLEKVFILNENTIYIKSMAYVEKFFLLIIGYDNGLVQIINLKDFSEVRRHKLNDNPVICISYIEQDFQFVTIQKQENYKLNFLKTWKLHNCESIKNANINDKIVTQCISIYYNSTNYLIIGFKDGKISIVNYKEIETDKDVRTEKRNLYGPVKEIKKFVFDSRNKMPILYTATDDQIIWIHNIDDHNDNLFIKIDTKSIQSLCLINQEVLAIGCSDSQIFFLNIKDEENIYDLNQVLKVHTNAVSDMFYDPKKNQLVTASRDCNIMINSIREIKYGQLPEELQKFELNELDENSEFDDDTVEFNYETCEIDFSPPININGHRHLIQGYYFDIYKKELTTAAMDKIIRVWDLENFKVNNYIQSNIFFKSFIALQDDNSTLVALDGTNKIYFISMKTKETYKIIEEKERCASILNLCDGNYFVVGKYGSKATVFRYISDGREIKVNKHSDLIHSEENQEGNSSNIISKIILIDYEKKIIGTGGSDGSNCVFDLKNSTKKYVESKNSFKILDMAKISENLIANIYDDGMMCIIDFESGEEKIKIEDDDFSCVCKLNDDYFCVGSNSLDHICIFSVEVDRKSLKKHKEIPVTYNYVSHLIYLKDGQTIAAINGGPQKGYSIDLITFL